jgi:hypothetical protein
MIESSSSNVSTTLSTPQLARHQQQQASMKLPSRGRHCEHRLCKSCSYQTYFKSKEATIRTRHSMMNCPICHTTRSFSGKRPTVDQDLLRGLRGSKQYRNKLAQLHQQPWKNPVGAFAEILGLVGKNGDADSHVSFKSDLIHDVWHGLIQVHDFQKHHRHWYDGGIWRFRNCRQRRIRRCNPGMRIQSGSVMWTMIQVVPNVVQTVDTFISQCRLLSAR